MCSSFHRGASLFERLAKFDDDLAAEARAAGCPRAGCGGRLDGADFPRKPRGAQVPARDDKRRSLCCARDGCRHRVTPPSLRFLGRKVFVGVVVVLLSALRHGITDARAGVLRREAGVSRSTLARWRAWWTTTFVATPFWQRARALLDTPVAEGELPGSLLGRFAGDDTMARVVNLLGFIKPVTTGSAGHLERISMGES